MSHHSTGKFALGALLGAAAGVVAGVLTAPKSGKETRQDLRRKAGEARQDVDARVSDLKVKGEHMAQEARHTLDDYRDRAGRAVSSAKAELRDEEKKKRS